MSDITVPVPDERVADFYKFFALWLEGDLDVNPRAAPVTGNRDLSPWGQTDKDHEDARWLWKQLSSKGRELFALLMANPGKGYTGEEIAHQIDIKYGSRGVAGTLAWPGRYCIQRGRQLPTQFREDSETDSSFYWMTKENAELFKEARANANTENAD